MFQFSRPGEHKRIATSIPAHLLVSLTHLVKTSLALSTRPASHTGLKRDAVANVNTRRLGAKLDDNTRALVAEAHRVLEHKRADARVLEVVHVRAADARLGDLDEDLVIFEGWDCSVVVRVGMGRCVLVRVWGCPVVAVVRARLGGTEEGRGL
jgi:hypothetical protein